MSVTTERTTDETSELVHSLARVGAAWARYGLGVAQLSLDRTAAVLGVLADEFHRIEKSKPKTEQAPIEVPGETTG